MKTIKNLERLQLLNEFIKQETTGTPKELSNKLGISERTVYNLIEILKDWEASICYCRKRKSYYYCDYFDLQLSVSLIIIKGDEQKQIYGGSCFLK